MGIRGSRVDSRERGEQGRERRRDKGRCGKEVLERGSGWEWKWAKGDTRKRKEVMQGRRNSEDIDKGDAEVPPETLQRGGGDHEKRVWWA